ncbi:MAG: signal peptidase I [Ruminococcus sp.]|nr:signal peptidase I [Ruminococcus sp.]
MCRKNNNIITAILCVLILTISIIFFYKYQIVIVNGNSMIPTLKSGQILIANKNFKDINYSDIVIFDLTYKESESQNDVTERVIKRVIALPGDRISSNNGRLTINSLTYNDYSFFSDTEQLILKSNELFVVGDNASGSSDSRVFGAISIDSVIAVYESK